MRSEFRECTRCGVEHQRKHKWCKDCNRVSKNERRLRKRRLMIERIVSTPPPPPPGFDPSDLFIGRPVL